MIYVYIDESPLLRTIIIIIILQNDATAIVNWVVNSLFSLQSAKCCYYYGHIGENAV